MRRLGYNKMNVAVQFTLALYCILSMYLYGYRAIKLRAFTSPHVHYELENGIYWCGFMKLGMQCYIG